MYFKDIVGNDILKKRIINNVKTGSIPHAMMYSGESGSANLAMAIATARYINCHNPTDQDSCGKCPSCKKYDIYAHPDLFFLYPIININSKNLCKDHLDQWRELLSLGAYPTYDDWLEILNGGSKKALIYARESGELMTKLSYRISEAHKRIIVIWLAEKMHDSLANKLLKLTEEPPEDTIIMMVCQDEKAILGTIKSRVQTIYIPPVEEECTRLYLQSIYPEVSKDKISIASHLALGNIRKALDIINGHNSKDQELIAIYKKVMRSTVNAVPIEMKHLSEEIATLSRDEQTQLIEYISKMFREIYIYNYDIPYINYLNPEEEAIAKYIKGCLNASNIDDINNELHLAMQHISQNVNSKMVFYDMLLRLTSKLTQSYKAKGVR